MRRDSQKAFETIFERYSKELYAYSQQFTKSAEEAEEIVHDVFLCLWKNRQQLKSVESLRAPRQTRSPCRLWLTR